MNNNNILEENPIKHQNVNKDNNFSNSNKNKNDFQVQKNNFVNNNQIIINHDIISDFKNPQLIGLQYIGNSPHYINAVLQCFCQIEKFVNYFKYKIGNYNNTYKYILTKGFKDLIENLWPYNDQFINEKFIHENKYNKYYAPYEMFDILRKTSSFFNENYKTEAKDLINYIIVRLHQELNKKKVNQNLSNNNYEFDQSNQKEMLKSFITKFSNENGSFISDNFYGSNQIQIECLYCRQIKYNYEIYSFLIFPLDEVIKQKVLKNQHDNIIAISDCFYYNQNIYTLSGENALPCNNCKTISSNNYQTLIYTFPEILILILEKNKNDKIKIQLEENLRLKDFVIEKTTGYKFKLIGIVSKIGEFGSNEHYISYCKSPINNYWYKYNNDLVSDINDFKKDIIDSIFPRILFYQKVKSF